MKKIAVVTGTRAEFGLLEPLLRKIRNSKELDLQLIATAMHLSPEFGETIKEIEERGYEVKKKVECLLSSDTATGVSKTMGVAMIGFADAFEELAPDLLILLGDRTELLAAASTAMVANIPIAHIHGGETTEGAYDESIRHAITKMSHLHFTSTDIYRKRVIQLGEDPARVFNVGAMSIDAIINAALLSKSEFEESINIRMDSRTLLITYHPVTLEKSTSEKQFQEILNALNGLEDVKFVFTHANSDKEGRVVNKMIEEFVQRNKERAVHFKSLGHLRYVSALKHVNAVVGNSSSGLVEVPYFNIPTINIGDRQKGRVAAESVIHTKPSEKSIKKALDQAFDKAFLKKIENQKQLFGEGDAAIKIFDILKEFRIKELKKKFYDIEYQI